MGNEMKQQEQVTLPQDFQALIAGFFPNAKHFDSRFDLFQVQIDESRRNQEQIKEQIRDFKGDTDRRFEQVDKRFEQVDKRFEQVDKRFEQVDKRFEQVDHRFQRLEDKIDNLIERIDVKVDSGLKESRNLIVRLFTFAISFSLVAVIGMFGKLFGLF
jgi:chromosome segregation ATPase